MEKWRDIPGYEGFYQVSDLGNIRSIRFNKIRNMKSWDSHGYRAVELCMNNNRYTVGIHRLVALTFIPNPENKSEVNHKDRNKSNNNVENLEWVTQSENVAHAYRHGVEPRPTHQDQPFQPSLYRNI